VVECGRAGQVAIAEVGLGHCVLVGSSKDLCRGRVVGSNGYEGYEGAGWQYHAGGSGWGEVAALG